MKSTLKDLLRPAWRKIRPLRDKVLGRPAAPVKPAKAKGVPAKRKKPKGPAAAMPRGGQVEMITHGLTGLKLAITAQVVTPELRKRIIAGRYEVHESKYGEKLLDRDEVVVELGAGLGLISTLVMKTGKARAVHCFEADSRLLPLIRATHAANGAEAVVLHHGAVTADAEALQRGYMEFHLRANFWGNSTTGNKGQEVLEVVKAPTIGLASIVKDYRPTVILADVEGAELGLFRDVDLSGVKRIMFEIHPGVLGPAGIRSVFADLDAAGFYFDSRFSAGQIVGMSRA
jgi:FkbM family methyltransferase